MKIAAIFLCTGSVLFCAAQKTPDPVNFANEIKTEKLRQHLYELAGPAYEGRETATAGQRKAAAYIENYFKSLGLAPGNGNSFQLLFPVFLDHLLSAAITINEDSFALGRDFETSVTHAYTASFGARQIVFAGYGISDSLQDDYRGLQTAGKIVLIRDGYPNGLLQSEITNKTFNSFAKQDAAMAHGAAALFIIRTDFQPRPAAGKGTMYRDFYRSTLRPNCFYISEKMLHSLTGPHGEPITNATAPGITYPANIFISVQKETQMLQSSDVLGYLPGSDLKDQLLVLSAHYDHLGKKDSVIYFGADDDGSGTVTLLEMASAFSKAKAAGRGPRRSILFLANSGEEKGLWGSEYYTDHPVYPLETTTADLNIDMIGRKDPSRKSGDSNNYVYVVGDDKLSTDLNTISVNMNKKYTGLELDYKYNDPKDFLRIYYRSDHYNFARKGVPIIFYFDGINPDYHRPSDTPDKIDYELMRKRAQLIFYTAWEMANRKDMLKRDLPAVTPGR